MVVLIQPPSFNGAGPNLVNTLEEGRSVEWIFPHQTSSHRQFVQLGNVPFVGPKGFDLTGEHQGIINHGSAQRFDAHGVSGENEFLRSRMPKGDGVHAVQG